MKSDIGTSINDTRLGEMKSSDASRSDIFVQQEKSSVCFVVENYLFNVACICVTYSELHCTHQWFPVLNVMDSNPSICSTNDCREWTHAVIHSLFDGELNWRT